ncbi:hypothetical protein ABW20_dc0102161 [Dactylellina cionopaga]|nr:hypothetical protein ABW20_dc0102161 [Dactylellina cionopaga]
MKFTAQSIAITLFAAMSVSAAPFQAPPKCPPGTFQALNAPGQPSGSWTCMPMSALPKPAGNPPADLNANRGYPNFDKRDDVKPKLSPKEWALKRAQHHNATAEEITFLNSVPDDIFQKMSDDGRKLHQAREALWSKTVPDMAALPTPFTRPEGSSPKPTGGPRPDHQRGQRPSRKQRFIKWAEKKGDVPAETLAKLNDTPDSVFDDLRNGTMKDRFVKEADLIGSTDLSNFFKNDVPQAVFDEITDLKTKVTNAHKDMKNKKIPTL